MIVTVLLDSDLLTLSRACAVLRRRNMPVRDFAVASVGQPGIWTMTCEIDVDDATAESITLLMQNVIGVKQATIVSAPLHPFPKSGEPMSAPVRIYYEKDTDPARLTDRTFAIIGYGSQGHAHALNLRDSGARVVVGLRPNGASWKRAQADGLDVRAVADDQKKWRHGRRECNSRSFGSAGL